YNKETSLAQGVGDAYDEISKKARAGAESSESEKQINDNLAHRKKLLVKQGALNDEIAAQKEEVARLEQLSLDMIKGQMAGADTVAGKATKAQKELNTLLQEQENITKNIDNLNKENINLSNKITFIPEE